ncbi:hypothetical protein E3J79_03950 [Candidatus Dependentiae bacterium]|nr:MAG: hypothetical protein E3J79_03950 [Candidatus Dependentiae bacterium]
MYVDVKAQIAPYAIDPMTEYLFTLDFRNSILFISYHLVFIWAARNGAAQYHLLTITELEA